MNPLPLAVTPGDPAGIGPDLCLSLASQPSNTQQPWFVIADPDFLSARTQQLGLQIGIHDLQDGHTPQSGDGKLFVSPLALPSPVTTGIASPDNARHTLTALRAAINGCTEGRYGALVTGPLNKAVINDAGIAFTGHTEYLAELTHAHPVMMLATEGLRVALVTTHLPLSEVPAAITAKTVEKVLRITHRDLQQRFGIAAPRMLVCGLNPHAGEGGHLGREEINIITPVLEHLREQGMDITGPLPADTLFTPKNLAHADVAVAMYHDQGLPVLKHKGFGDAVNITLGLPIIRTSVDHGTAYDLAGTGKADTGSLQVALRTAAEMARHSQGQPT